MTRLDRIQRVRQASEDPTRTEGERAAYARKAAELTRTATEGARLYARSQTTLPYAYGLGILLDVDV